MESRVRLRITNETIGFMIFYEMQNFLIIVSFFARIQNCLTSYGHNWPGTYYCHVNNTVGENTCHLEITGKVSFLNEISNA